MKKMISSLLMLLTFTAFAQAPAHKPTHEQKTPEERATAIAAHLEKSLVLSADQKTKVHDLALAKEKKIEQLKEQNKGKDRCAWADQRKQAQTEFESGMKQTLTPDQYTKWTEQKAERSKKRTEHQPHGAQQIKTPEQRAEAAATHFEKELMLTPDQKTKVRDLVLAREKANDQLREKYKGQDPCSSSAERKQVSENFDNGMKAALTPEQFQKWEAQKKQRAEERRKK
jgi:protein CpxP